VEVENRGEVRQMKISSVGVVMPGFVLKHN